MLSLPAMEFVLCKETNEYSGENLRTGHILKAGIFKTLKRFFRLKMIKNIKARFKTRGE